MSQPDPVRGRPAAIVALVAMAYFAVAAVATHIASPQYDFVRNYISDYAIGPLGWIYASAFLASCVSCLALALALWQALRPEGLSRAGVALLGIVGITYVVDFFFPTDLLAPGEPPRTMTGEVHFAAAGLGWLLFVASAFLITARLRHDPHLARWQATLLALAWLAVALLVALIAVTVTRQPYGGLVEKAFILDRNAWALVLVVGLLQAPWAAPPSVRLAAGKP